MGGALEIFNLAWKFQDLEFFQSLGPQGSFALLGDACELQIDKVTAT